jgi:hypothetical protein
MEFPLVCCFEHFLVKISLPCAAPAAISNKNITLLCRVNPAVGKRRGQSNTA